MCHLVTRGVYVGLNLHSLVFFFLIIMHIALVFVSIFICDEPYSVFLFVVLSAGCAALLRCTLLTGTGVCLEFCCYGVLCKGI